MSNCKFNPVFLPRILRGDAPFIAPAYRIAMYQAADRLVELEAKLAKAQKGLLAVQNLIDDSDGVYGLSFNGKPMPWSDLQSGGYYAELLVEFDVAINAEKEDKEHE